MFTISKIIHEIFFRDNVTKEELLEAATALARALWYLDEHGIVHSNIRLGNVFVSEHRPGTCFKVKLGDPGLPDYNNPKEAHWLSFELLLDSCPTPSKCTSKGDVWAFATTLWELFSYGELPSLDPVFAKEQVCFCKKSITNLLCKFNHHFL